MIAAIAGCVAFDVIEERVQRVHEPPNETKGDLILGMGSFLVCDTGVTAKLAPPLGILSRHYDWKWIPPGFAALRLAMTGEGESPGMLYRYMSSSQRDMLEDKLGVCSFSWEGDQEYFNHDSDLVDDVERVWDWMPSLIPVCPYQSVAHDIRMVRGMSDPDLDRYVMGKLL